MVTSSEAYFEQKGQRFILGTGRIEKQIELTDRGEFLLRSYQNTRTGFEAADSGRLPSDEFAVTVDGVRYEGMSGGWALTGVATALQGQGELEAILTLTKDALTVERHYLAYPGQAVIGEWTVYRNLADHPVSVSHPSLYVGRLLEGEEKNFSYMTGGANFTGSLVYKTQPLTPGYHREFDSHGTPEVMEVEGRTASDMHPIPNGTGIWCEFFTLSDRQRQEGCFVTFDYQGWWKADICRSDGVTSLRVWCELKDYTLAAGEEMPIAPMSGGLWAGDTDDLGNTLGDYIYTYKWDATRPRYFLETCAVIWREAPLTQRVFQMIEYARYIGVEQIHVDDFWFDAKGNWNGIFGDDWRHNHDYMRRNGMDFRLWMPPWHADRLSRVWLEHPDWMLNFHGNWYNWSIDLSREDAYQWVLSMICDKQREFGPYMLRVDGNPACMVNDGSFTASGGNYNPSYKQSENFYRLYREFKQMNPDAGLNGCSSGGHTMTIESVRYTDDQQLTDGNCLHLGPYWATLFNPIDKVHPYSFGELMQNPEKPYAAETLEVLRLRCERAKWMRREGLAGRYIKVYRPEVLYGDKTYFLQRMTWDGLRGMILIGGSPNPALGKSERIFPKGLVPDAPYTVDALRGGLVVQTRTGAQWMREGIFVELPDEGEEIYFNLQNRPGMGTDTQPPTEPAWAKKGIETWLGHTGVAVEWAPASDDGMLSYYELMKNGKPVTKVSTGCFYFDADGDLGNQYSVCAVDADGNRSGSTAAV